MLVWTGETQSLSCLLREPKQKTFIWSFFLLSYVTAAVFSSSGGQLFSNFRSFSQKMAADNWDMPLKRMDLKACLFTKDVQAVQRSRSCKIKPSGFQIQIPPYFEVRLQAMCPKPLANRKAGDVFQQKNTNSENWGGEAGARINDLHTAYLLRKSNTDALLSLRADGWIYLFLNKASWFLVNHFRQKIVLQGSMQSFSVSLLNRSLHLRKGRANPPHQQR